MKISIQTPHGKMLIRDYENGDETAVVCLVRELQAHEHERYNRMKSPDEIGAWYIDELKRKCAEHEGRILIALKDEEPVGYVTILTHVHMVEPDETEFEYAEIGDLAVTASQRSKGIGAALIAAAESVAREAGARWLRISVLAQNSGAVKLYRGAGFTDHLLELEKPLSRE